MLPEGPAIHVGNRSAPSLAIPKFVFGSYLCVLNLFHYNRKIAKAFNQLQGITDDASHGPLQILDQVYPTLAPLPAKIDSSMLTIWSSLDHRACFLIAKAGDGGESVL